MVKRNILIISILILTACGTKETPKPKLNIQMNEDYSTRSGRVEIDVSTTDAYSSETLDKLCMKIVLVKNPDFKENSGYLSSNFFDDDGAGYAEAFSEEDYIDNSSIDNTIGKCLDLEKVANQPNHFHYENDFFTSISRWKNGNEKICPFSRIIVVVQEPSTRSNKIKESKTFPCEFSENGMSDITGNVTIEEPSATEEPLPIEVTPEVLGNYCELKKSDSEIASDTVQDDFLCTYFSILENKDGNLVGRIGYQVLDRKAPFKNTKIGQAVQLGTRCLQFDNLSTGETGEAECTIVFPGIRNGEKNWVVPPIQLPQSWHGTTVRATWWIFEVFYTEENSSLKWGGVGNPDTSLSLDGRPASECDIFYTHKAPCSFGENTTAPYIYQVILETP